jgi:hypothetical protein
VTGLLKQFVQRAPSSKTPFSKIDKSKMIMVEGVDDLNFIHALLLRLRISDIQIVDIGGNPYFEEQLEQVKLGNRHRQLTSLALIADADQNPQRVFEELRTYITNLGWVTPPQTGLFSEHSDLRVGVYILPNNQDFGTLEHLLLQTLPENDPLKRLAYEFYDNVEHTRVGRLSRFPSPDNRRAKFQSSAYLLTTDFGDTRAGVAAERGVWNLDHPCLDELKAFLRQL